MKAVNCFRKMLHLRCLAGFRLRPSSKAKYEINMDLGNRLNVTRNVKTPKKIDSSVIRRQKKCENTKKIDSHVMMAAFAFLVQKRVLKSL